MMSEKTLNRILALVVFLVPLVVFLRTMAPTLVFWDSGEFIAAAHVLGIPHSPGTPLFTLAGRIFTMLPLPLSIGGRSNFFSVVCAAFAVLMAYLIMVGTLRFMFPTIKGRLERFMLYVGPIVGSLFITFSDSYWRDSTETEVYALNAVVMGLCAWLAIVWYRNPAGKVERATAEGLSREALVEEERLERGHSRGLVYLMIYLCALGIGFHLGTVLVYGGIFFLFLLVKEKSFGNAEIIVYTFGFAVILADMTMHRNSSVTLAGLAIFAVLVAWSTVRKGRFALVATGLLALGISVHLYMVIRAFHNPAINMVNPRTWGAMHYHLRREQYPPSNMFERKAPLGWQFGYFWGYFKEQFRMFGDFKVGPFNLGEAATAIPVALGLWGIAANFKGERKLWVLNFTNLIVNSLGLILFLNFSANEVRDRDYFYGVAFYFFGVFIGIGATALLVATAEWARRKRREGAPFVVPLGMLLIVLSILPCRHNWFTHDRSRYYIARDYGYNLLAALEPDAIIFTYGDNDTYPLWYIQNVEHYRTDVRVANLSLLNTDWYIKQLRDEEPKVPIALSDREIERMMPIRLSNGGIAWKNDLMVQHIIETSDWKRPIYFATTVAPEDWAPYQDYLEMQGMVRRLVPYRGKYMRNGFLMERGFSHIFRFRGILTKDWQMDDSMYRERDLNVIVGNYAVALYELGQTKWQEEDFPSAAYWMERSLRLDPNLKPAKTVLGVFYAMNNEPQRAIDYYSKLVEQEPADADYWLRLAWSYSLVKNFGTALQIIDRGIKNAPESGQLFIDGYRYAVTIGNSTLAKSYLEAWLAKHPDDEEFRKAYEDIDRVLQKK